MDPYRPTIVSLSDTIQVIINPNPYNSIKVIIPTSSCLSSYAVKNEATCYRIPKKQMFQLQPARMLSWIEDLSTDANWFIPRCEQELQFPTRFQLVLSITMITTIPAFMIRRTNLSRKSKFHTTYITRYSREVILRQRERK